MRYSIETRDFFVDIISSVSTELHSKKKYNNNKNNNNNNNNNNNDNEDVELTTHKKDTYLQKKDSKLLMN